MDPQTLAAYDRMRRPSPTTGTSSRRRPTCTRWCAATSSPAGPPTSAAAAAAKSPGSCANGYPAVGYDPSEGLLAQARARYPAACSSHAQRCRSLRGSRPRSFDNVLCETVIMHLPPRSDRAVGGPARFRCFRPGGVLYRELARHAGSRISATATRRLYAAFDKRLVLEALPGADNPARRRGHQRIVRQGHPPHRCAHAWKRSIPTSTSCCDKPVVKFAIDGEKSNGDQSRGPHRRRHRRQQGHRLCDRQPLCRLRRRRRDRGARARGARRGGQGDRRQGARPGRRLHGRRRQGRRHRAHPRRGDEGVRQDRHRRQQCRHLRDQPVREADRRLPAARPRPEAVRRDALHPAGLAADEGAQAGAASSTCSTSAPRRRAAAARRPRSRAPPAWR